MRPLKAQQMSEDSKSDKCVEQDSKLNLMCLMCFHKCPVSTVTLLVLHITTCAAQTPSNSCWAPEPKIETRANTSHCLFVLKAAHKIALWSTNELSFKGRFCRILCQSLTATDGKYVRVKSVLVLSLHREANNHYMCSVCTFWPLGMRKVKSKKLFSTDHMNFQVSWRRI